MSDDHKIEDEPFDMLTSDIVMELAELGRDVDALSVSDLIRRDALVRELDRRVPRTR